jgi:hypothetical protein
MPEKKAGFFLFILVLILVAAILLFMGWDRSGFAEKSQEGTSKYLGAAGCRCHQQEGLGGQVQRWTGTGHARSYLALGTGCPEMIEAEAKGMVEVGHGRGVAQEAMRLGEDTHCLKCHATAAEVEPAFLEPTFHIEDGVQCEACHGPAGGHVAVMMGKKGTSPTEARLKRPTKEDCMACHHEKPSHAGLKGKPFNCEKAWKKIAHPMPKKGRK